MSCGIIRTRVGQTVAVPYLTDVYFAAIDDDIHTVERLRIVSIS